MDSWTVGQIIKNHEEMSNCPTVQLSINF
ncbi:MAG: hypothetical protein EZS28_040386, partial [Streblomastix strix]